MLYDRQYMRQPAEPVAKNTSVVMKIFFATIAVFVLQSLLNVFLPGYNGRNYFLNDWFALSGQSFRELKVWTVLSYGFLHSSATSSFFFIPIPFAHLIFNMLGLYLIGRPVQAIIGNRNFLFLYFGSILMGAFAYLLINYHTAQSAIGASAAISAIVAFFCLAQPNRQMVIIPIPVPIKAKWLFWGILVISLFGLRSEIAHETNIAHSTHLGGILAGVLFFRFVHNSTNSFFKSQGQSPAIELPEWFKRKQKIEPKVTYKVNSSSRDELQAEVDRILDKINTSGFGSLTSDEQKSLDKAKDIVSK